MKTVPEGELLPIENHFEGSLRYRLRCCKSRKDKGDVAESNFVTMLSYWPGNIFINFNGSVISVRRKSHNGKDLPVELTHLIRVGVNDLKVVIPSVMESPETKRFVLGVEVIETASRETLLESIRKRGVPAAITVGKIRSRLETTAGDDDFVVVQDGISVDLADPFSATMITVPVRGAQCEHIECFDLHNWLSSRPPLALPEEGCQHKAACRCPKHLEPSLPDKWLCPICSKDARPCNLVIDSFLYHVREQLVAEGKADSVKSILVQADGSWKAVTEAIASDDSANRGDKGKGKEAEAETDTDVGDDASTGVSRKRERDEEQQQNQNPTKAARTTATTEAGSATRAGDAARAREVVEIDD